ncbi:TerB family tellurite resistance protein [candidate division CSSED10-310 bacterium]|uniref:TerB family tellurite resistance protein n=1 Tax=candidate division CSSED10-310 bacterium TaxID=2855610 RepID=A0ABV6Z1Q0_UNCC1
MSKNSSKIAYPFLLYTHMVCADGQIHTKEVKKLEDLFQEFHINQVTKDEKDKIISQSEDMLCLREILPQIPEEDQLDCLKTLAIVSYCDGFCDPLERKMLDEIACAWKIDQRNSILFTIS